MTTPRLTITYLTEGQPQAEATINDALNRLDAFINPTIINSTTTTPPGSPTTGDTYVVGASATGAWSGKDGQMAVWFGGWVFLNAKPLNAIVAKGRITAQTATANVCTYTPPADGDFEVGGNAVVTALAVGLFLQVTYTDETNASQTKSFNASAVTATGSYPQPTMTIRAKAATVITIKVTETSGTFNASGFIRQVQ